MSGGPMLAVAVSPGTWIATEIPSKMLRLLLGHVLGRPEGDRPDVDPGYEERHEREPPELLEEGQEPEAEEDEGDSLAALAGSSRSRT